jgi:hypothetical protein
MKKIAGSFPGLVVVLSWLLFAGAAAAAPLVLFDQSHEQRFVIASDDPLHLSGLAAVMKGEGLDVRSSSGPLTAESLKGVDALIISGPFKALDAAEVAAVAHFVEHGGRLAAMLHIGSPFAELLQRLEVNFTNYVLYEQENIIDGDPRNFQVKTLQASPLFAGIDHFSLYGGWALMNSASHVKVVAATSPRGWIDVNGDRKLSKGDLVGSFGVVVTGELGAGRYVVFGDDAIFQNRFLDEQNRQLAKNLARWLK